MCRGTARRVVTRSLDVPGTVCRRLGCWRSVAAAVLAFGAVDVEVVAG
jgi:hypothetical protein